MYSATGMCICSLSRIHDATHLLFFLTGAFRMASFNNSHHHFGSTASSLRRLKSILNASLIGSNESVLISSETVLRRSNNASFFRRFHEQQLLAS
jgi:hypothetical protein